MSKITTILCPVDLSPNSRNVIELATSLALHHKAELVFQFVCPLWVPDVASDGRISMEQTIERDREELRLVRPTDSRVTYKHLLSHGNPGPQIVQTARDCDMVVMSMHGYTGLSRILMGSVAEYVVRHADCPVLTVKNPKPEKAKQLAALPQGLPEVPVTKAMNHVTPVHCFDKIEAVAEELKQAGQTAAPVVDGSGRCIGILTQTDIDHYRELKDRYEAHDETVIDEMFETDSYGMRRPDNLDFDQVQRHMSKPVVTISNNESTTKARELFEAEPSMHHLVVIDDQKRALGIVDHVDVAGSFVTQGVLPTVAR